MLAVSLRRHRPVLPPSGPLVCAIPDNDGSGAPSASYGRLATQAVRPVTVHSDQGSQFTSREWQTFLGQRGLEPSMSRRGNCHDKSHRRELLPAPEARTYPASYLPDPRCRDAAMPRCRDAARQDVFEYIEMFYNLKRKHTNNGMLCAVDFEIRQQKLNEAGV